MGKVVLVTGVAGELAGGLARKLATAGDSIDKVVGVDVTAPVGELSNVKFVRADIRTPVIGKVIAVEEVDTVVHMNLGPELHNTVVRGGAKEINVIGTMQLLAACQRVSTVRKIVVQSSTAVYGASPRDPAKFTESQSARGGIRGGFSKDIVDAEGYIRGFSRRRPDVTITTLRLSHILSPHIPTPINNYLNSAVLPTVLGFDPRFQFLHEADAFDVLERAVNEEQSGIFNIAGDGILLLSQIARRLGKVRLPLPPLGFNAAARTVMRRTGSHMPSNVQGLLTYGRVVDTTAARETFGFVPRYSTEETFEQYRSAVRPGVLSVLGGIA